MDFAGRLESMSGGALKLVHSSRCPDESDAILERPLSLIQGGRDPAAEEAARVAAIYKARDEELVRIRTGSARRQQQRIYWLLIWLSSFLAALALYLVLVRCGAPWWTTLPLLLVAGFVQGQMLRRAL